MTTPSAPSPLRVVTSTRYRLEYQPVHLAGSDNWVRLPGAWYDRESAVGYADSCPSYPHRVVEAVTTETVIYERATEAAGP